MLAMSNLMDKPRRILISRIDRLGDVVLSTPIIANLRAAFPDAYIAFMCRPQVKDIVVGNPNLDEVILYDRDGKHKNFFQTFIFALALARKNFDWSISVHACNRAHWIPFLAGIGVRIGWNIKNGWLLTKRVVHTKHEGKKHEIEYSLDLLRAVDIPVVTSETYFPVGDGDILRTKDILREHGVDPQECFIVIHPSASCPSKRWPQEYYLQLSFKLMPWGKVIMATGQSDVTHTQEIAKDKRIIDLRGKLTLAQMGCLLKLSKLLITNDSGPMHVAAALNVPVIAIFGRSNPGTGPDRWRPLGENSHTIFRDCGCSPCLAHGCFKGFRCLKAIAPDDVYEVARKVLEKEKKHV
jgi:heptosyltransferase-2